MLDIMPSLWEIFTCVYQYDPYYTDICWLPPEALQVRKDKGSNSHVNGTILFRESNRIYITDTKKSNVIGG